MEESAAQSEARIVATAENQSQHGLMTAGQRKVNLIWEFTQAFIAILITTAIVADSVMVMLPGNKNEAPIPNILCAGFGLVVGTYFQRTNHNKIGGVGDKPSNER